jgi:hypothetical protein
MMIEALKGYIPACNRVYVPDRKTWRVDAYAHDCLQGWLSYARTTFSAQVQWSGSAADADPEREWTPPPPPRQKPKAVDPYQVLHLRETAPPELVKVAYRCLAQLNHPDHGGDTEAMQRINDAYQRLAA